jgi:hypothetical protein
LEYRLKKQGSENELAETRDHASFMLDETVYFEIWTAVDGPAGLESFCTGF